MARAALPLRCLAACLPAAAVIAHALPFPEPLWPPFRWLWIAAGALVSLAWIADTLRAGDTAAPAAPARRQRLWLALAGAGLLLFGHFVYWHVRHHVDQGSELLRVVRRGPGGGALDSRELTADELAREDERKRAQIGLVLLLGGGLLLGKAIRDSLPQGGSAPTGGEAA